MAKVTESKVKPVQIDPKQASKEQIAKGLELLAKAETRKKRVAAGELKGGGANYADMTPEQKEQRKAYNDKRRIKMNLIIQKATDAGITVSDKEVLEEMKRRGL